MSTRNRPRMKDWSLKERTGASADAGVHTGSVVIRRARILDPATQTDDTADLRIDGGRITAIGTDLDTSGARVLEAVGLWLLPGLVDLSARFREPGQTRKASFASEVRAAQAGGIAHVLIPPDTSPVIDSPASLIRLQRIAQQHGGISTHVLGALTRELRGEALAELSALKAAGAVGASNAMAPVHDSLIARRALEYARGLNMTVHVFAQDPVLAAGGCAHEGAVATRLGLSAVPVAAEVAAMRFWISLVEDTGGRVHFCRVSTARGVELVESARERDLPVTADVAAHQLHLTDQDVDGFNAQCHVQPPLRTAADRDALRAGVASGTIEAICSDHQPHETDAKINPFPMTEPGISGLETLLPLTLALVHDGLLTPLAAISRLTQAPARIAAIDGGHLAIGASADLTLVDPNAHWVLRAERMLSAGRNTPFNGRRLQGQVRHTFHAGIEVFSAPTS